MLFRVDRRQLDVRHHHAGGAGGDAGPEGRQFHRVQPLARMRHHRQTEMRVDVGVAVAGEMLQRRQHARILQAADPSRHHRASACRILAERSDVDHRIARVVVHIRDRTEVDVHAEGPRFRADDLAGFVGQLRIAGRAERHRPRELRGAGDAHLHAPFEVGRGQKRQRRDRLQAIEDRRQFHRLAKDHGAVGVVQHDLRNRLGAAECDHAADLRFVNELDERLVFVAVATEIGGLKRREDHLPDQLFEGHLLDGRVDPGERGLVETVSLARQRHREDGDAHENGPKHAPW